VAAGAASVPPGGAEPRFGDAGIEASREPESRSPRPEVTRSHAAQSDVRMRTPHSGVRVGRVGVAESLRMRDSRVGFPLSTVFQRPGLQGLALLSPVEMAVCEEFGIEVVILDCALGSSTPTSRSWGPSVS